MGLFAAASLGLTGANAETTLGKPWFETPDSSSVSNPTMTWNVEIKTSEPQNKKLLGKVVIKQGETHRFLSYVQVLSKEEAKARGDVFYAKDDYDHILGLILGEVKKLNDSPNSADTKDDTLLVQADSIVVTKSLLTYENSKSTASYYAISLYDGEEENTYTYSTTNSSRESRLKNALSDVMSALSDDEYLSEAEMYDVYENANGQPKKKWSTNTILTCDLVLGYGYLNWAQNNPFSEPAGSDAHSLKWSNRWDIMLAFKLFPDNPIYFSTGVGYQSNVFRFEDGLSLYPFEDGVAPVGFSAEKTKLVARYITVPLMLNFRLARRVELHLGAIGGLNYRNSHTGFKASYSQDGEKHELSTGSSFNNFATFKADAFVGIELCNFTFYVSHSLTDMFDNAYPKSLYPFSFGIMLGL